MIGREATNARSAPYSAGRPSGSSTTGSAPLPCLPVLSATSCSIQSPSARSRRRQRDGELVAAFGSGDADEGAELEPGVLVVFLTASFSHVAARGEHVADRRADQRGGDETEERQRGEPPADVGRIEEHAPVAARVREVRERRPGSVMATKCRPASLPSAATCAARTASPSTRLRSCRRSCWRRGTASARARAATRRRGSSLRRWCP